MNLRGPIEKEVLYGGRVVLEFDMANHRYYVTDLDDGRRRPVPGVTSILGVLARPALVNWAASQAAEYVAENLRPGVPLDEVEIRELADGARMAHRRAQKRAATVGSVVHEWIERYARGRIGGRRLRVALPENAQARRGVEAFLDWVDAHKVDFLESERRVYSREHGYAGTADLVAVVDGDLVLIDVKTSKGIYPEYELQLAAYWRAIEEEWATLPDEPPAFNWAAILRVGKDDGVFEIREVLPDRRKFWRAFDVFEALIRVWRWRERA